ncbi:hypothetical protein SAMD00023353_2101590 [Rosellinia necatrix]|uniref:Uncharacterized protein n=1 Tax=Rosellinia necatrix TaxID=77044 RepID=A0A1W2TF99_ROSNE|nr:hypothetical protein SAMD00023353_2101590 [Rosellinia necatrix]
MANYYGDGGNDGNEGGKDLRWSGVRVDAVDEVGELWYPRASTEYSCNGGVRSSGARSFSDMPSRSATFEAILAYLTEVMRLVERSVRAHPLPPRGVTGPRREAVWRVPCAERLLVEPKFVRGHPDVRRAHRAALEDVRRCVHGGDDDAWVSKDARPYMETMLRWVKKRPRPDRQRSRWARARRHAER